MSAKVKVDRAKFTELTQDGWTIKELAKHFECDPRTISRLRKSLNLPADTRRFMTAERRANIEAMLDDGWSFAEISRTEGAHEETLRIHFPGRQWTRRQQVEYVATLRIGKFDWNRAASNNRNERRIAA